jgi:hypothetical protein
VIRLAALWRTWETARLATSPYAMADWHLNYLDRMLPVLLASKARFTAANRTHTTTLSRCRWLSLSRSPPCRPTALPEFDLLSPVATAESAHVRTLVDDECRHAGGFAGREARDVPGCIAPSSVVGIGIRAIAGRLAPRGLGERHVEEDREIPDED